MLEGQSAMRMPFLKASPSRNTQATSQRRWSDGFKKEYKEITGRSVADCRHWSQYCEMYKERNAGGHDGKRLQHDEARRGMRAARAMIAFFAEDLQRLCGE